MQTQKKGIQKYHFWLLFFFAIFGFTFAMIIWTIKSASSVPVYEDESFMQSYHDVDENFNTMMIANHKFNQRYDTEISINDRTLGLEVNDIFHGQRSLEKSKNRNLLSLGENRVTIKVIDKQTGELVPNAKVDLVVTRSIEDSHDIKLNEIPSAEGAYRTPLSIEVAGNWNISGVITIGEDKGYLFIKTNTQK